jgi:hypothetical protein
VLLKNKGVPGVLGFNEGEEKIREEYESKIALREKFEEEEKKKKEEGKEEVKFDY